MNILGATDNGRWGPVRPLSDTIAGTDKGIVLLYSSRASQRTDLGNMVQCTGDGGHLRVITLFICDIGGIRINFGGGGKRGGSH